jgi:hypothetical protein
MLKPMPIKAFFAKKSKSKWAQLLSSQILLPIGLYFGISLLIEGSKLPMQKEIRKAYIWLKYQILRMCSLRRLLDDHSKAAKMDQTRLFGPRVHSAARLVISR